jgi:membrane-associated phospholipid phosphatase
VNALRGGGIRNLDRRVLYKSIAAATVCLITFAVLRLLLLVMDGPSRFDVWLESHVRQEHASRTIKIAEYVASLPGSRKGAVVLIVFVAAWAWFRWRDVRPGVFLMAAFTVTTATVALLKGFLAQVMPIASPDGELEDRVFLSTHTANAVAVFAMLAVVIALSRRDLLHPVVTLAVVVVGSVALSVMAADRHYLVDVVSGAAVAGFWVSALVPVVELVCSRATRDLPSIQNPGPS